LIFWAEKFLHVAPCDRVRNQISDTTKN
jgi:hypothetical protein